MSEVKQRFFIALLPSPEVQGYATNIKQHFAAVYNSRAALKSPPHITLHPPFLWPVNRVATLAEVLARFAANQSAVPVSLSGYGAFKPRVIYIKVLKTAELLALRQGLLNVLASSLDLCDPKEQSRPFSPHLTVAFRDLTKQNFYQAWPEFERQTLAFDCQVEQLTLLLHNGRCWEIHQQFAFNGGDRAS